MADELKIKLYSVVLDCKDPDELAKFYAALQGWDIVFSNEEYTVLGAPGVRQGAYPGLTIQKNPDYQPPVWPDAPDAQQQMAHLDFAVNDLDKAVEHAIRCGATIAGEQFTNEWTVMLDPAGHPFCLVPMKQIIESNHFGLL